MTMRRARIGWTLAGALAFVIGCGGGYDKAAEAPVAYGYGGMSAPAGYPGTPMREEAIALERTSSTDAEPPAEPAPAMDMPTMQADYATGSVAPDYAKAPPAPPPKPSTTTKNAPGKDGKGGEGGSSPGTGIEDPSRKQPVLIYTADFTMSVYEVAKSLEAVEGIAKSVGGYLSRRDDRGITIRIPADKFNDVIVAIEKVGDVLHRNVVSEDVTAEYRDLEVQLTNALALRARFEKLLEKAVKVEEALEIERELGRITGEIETIKGRLKLLSDLARYSTVTVTFQPRSTSQIQQGPFVLPLPWLNNVGLRRLMSL